jgi:probable addiction module antidote protein
MANQHPAPALDTLESIARYLAEAFDAGDPARIATALASVADATGFPELAAATGTPREALRASLQSGQLSMDVTLAIMKVIDLHLPPRTGSGS